MSVVELYDGEGERQGRGGETRRKGEQRREEECSSCDAVIVGITFNDKVYLSSSLQATTTRQARLRKTPWSAGVLFERRPHRLTSRLEAE